MNNNRWSYQPGAEDRGKLLAKRVIDRLFPVSKVINCTSCGSENNMHSGKDPRGRPQEGDTSICFYCGEIQVFTFVNGQLDLRKPTRREAARFDCDPGVIESRRLIAENSSPTEAVMKRWGLI